MSRRNYVSSEWLHDYALGMLVHINAADARKGFSPDAITATFGFSLVAVWLSAATGVFPCVVVKNPM